MAHNNQNTMRAVVWEGKPFHVTVKSVPSPHLIEKADVIVRVTTSAICGSDLHIYHGIFGSSQANWVIGHEAIGIITEIGKDVKHLRIGDRVIIPDIPDDGALNIEPRVPQLKGFGFGDDFGFTGGCQAEYVRVPEADNSCIPVPEGEFSDVDFLFLSDIFATGWTGLDFSGFQPGDTVAVFGAGPMGLLCAYSALLRGASKVYSIDHVEARLKKAASIGAIPINFTNHPASEQLAVLEPNGVIRSVDCCGYECVNADLKPQQNFIVEEASKVTAAGGGFGVPGLYWTQASTQGAPLAGKVKPEITFPMAAFWAKGIRIQGGPVDPKLVAPTLVQLVKSGRAKPGFIVSADIGIEEAPKFYERFDKHLETKVVIRFPWEEDEIQEATLAETTEGSTSKPGESNGERAHKRARRS
ncbi:alcohol dehydrogenase [Clohesyomyces aquaticus]|uniref:Alcohol dehydrogenase n=1 Tax=Clohesyomyces aquaticus TaxID=1231657 RepID=A0A1Y1ZRH2_9PLEO|nr:alcohol dehydrogenase [Clohesyomyces aquaticus]